MNVFTYDNANNRLEINEPEILLIREFKALSDRDKTKNKSRLWRELTYIYLAIDWKSLYNQYTEQERHQEALSDSGITEEEFNELRTCFNVPSLGKLVCTYERYLGMKKRFKYLNSLKSRSNA